MDAVGLRHVHKRARSDVSEWGRSTNKGLVHRAESCDLCVGASLLNLTGCVWRLCPDVVETLAEDGNDADRDSNPKPAPEFSQAKFDMSSFIGGIILVLCVQAGGFFAMRFLKSKEQSNYETM
ncbi:hypothetical protein NL108_008669 [Boleophthalmus pectinirostris]|nr:hypothetical protein NL108_008669 [Boleophthalmus pectinirostris]